MTIHPEYDGLAEIYLPWSEADPAYKSSMDFYVNSCMQSDGRLVELGIGTGRIALEVARKGRSIVGIDISPAMLARCRLQAKALGVEHLVELVQADLREFTLPTPASLVILPFRTIGHLLTQEARKDALKHIHSQLLPGGIFAFDHYVFDRTWAEIHDGIPKLMCRAFLNSKSCDVLVWDTYRYDFANQTMNCLVTIEDLDNDGLVMSRRHNPLTFAWVEPNEIEGLADEIGFEVIGMYGGFDKSEFTPAARDQVWVLRRRV